MGRHREGWKLRKPKDGRAHFTVRFTDNAGVPREFTTGKSDPREAADSAAEIYTRWMTSASSATRVRVNPLLALDEHFSQWLASIETTHDRETCATYTQYARRFIAFFGGTISRITAPRMGDYQRVRLGQVTRSTLLKEKSAMNGFLLWCQEQELLTEENRPRWPRLPKKATGTRSGPQRENPVDVTAAQVNAFLAALPAWSTSRKRAPFAIRARFIVAYETGLRPATLDELEMPKHWRPGATEILIDNAIDKNRFGRKVPISARCAEALERTVLTLGLSSGLIFGAHDYRHHVDKAARAVGLPEDFAPYDLRHGRAGHLLDAGATMRAVAYLHGHRRLTTTDRYLRGQETDARAAVQAASIGGESGAKTTDSDDADSEAENMSNISAKEGGRTPTALRPLEPESSGSQERTASYVRLTAPEEPNSVDGTPIHGAAPETLVSAARYLAALRVEWDDFDAVTFAAEDFDDDGGPS